MKLTKAHLSNLEGYLKTNYLFRYNILKEKPEYKPHNTDQQFIAINRYVINTIKRNILIDLDLNINYTDLERIIESNFAQICNPVKQYFEDLPNYNFEKDYIKDLCNTIVLASNEGEDENKTFEIYFKKWLSSVVANVFDEFVCRNHTCLVLTGEQGTFKTTWLENLCPKSLKNIYLFSGKIDPNGKEVQSIIAEYLFCNIDDQLSQLNRKDENDLKELITKNKVSYRRPFTF
jgi:predicted P-loop ATPase